MDCVDTVGLGGELSTDELVKKLEDVDPVSVDPVSVGTVSVDPVSVDPISVGPVSVGPISVVEKLEDVDPVSVGITVDVPLLEIIVDVVKGSELETTELVVLFEMEGASLEPAELLTTVD